VPPDEEELRVLFGEAIDAFAGARALHSVDPNIAFDPASLPPETRQYLRVSTMASEPEPIGTGAESLYLWTYQVLVCARSGLGELAPLRHAQALRAAFLPFHEFLGTTDTFRVIRTAEIASPVPRDGWYTIPVRFRVQCIT